MNIGAVMTTRWHISDTHFWHSNVIKHCSRPWADVVEMNEALIANWNSCVKPEDTIIHYGDYSFAGFEKTFEITRRLNGHKIIICGNHDIQNKMHKRWERLGFAEFHYTTKITVGGIECNVSHFPYSDNNDSLNRKFDLQLKNDGLPLLCGHVHQEWKTKDNMINLGVDVWNYKPVHEDELVFLLKGIK